MRVPIACWNITSMMWKGRETFINQRFEEDQTSADMNSAYSAPTHHIQRLSLSLEMLCDPTPHV